VFGFFLCLSFQKLNEEREQETERDGNRRRDGEIRGETGIDREREGRRGEGE